MSKKKSNDMTYIHDLLAKIDSRLDDMHEVQVRHDENLKEHMKRTAMLEDELKPIKKHVDKVTTVGQFLLGTVGLLALIATIYAAVK